MVAYAHEHANTLTFYLSFCFPLPILTRVRALRQWRQHQTSISLTYIKWWPLLSVTHSSYITQLLLSLSLIFRVHVRIANDFFPFSSSSSIIPSRVPNKHWKCLRKFHFINATRNGVVRESEKRWVELMKVQRKMETTIRAVEPKNKDEKWDEVDK